MADGHEPARVAATGGDMLELGERVNLWRIRMYNAVNRRMGYPPVDMRSPKELVNED